MQNDALHRYFAAVLRLRHLLQAQESLEDAWKKVPVPRRFLWLLPLASFAAAFFAQLVLPVLREKTQRRQRKKHFPHA